MNKIIFIIALLLLVSCSVENVPDEKEEITEDIEYTLEDSQVYVVEDKELIKENYFIINPSSGNKWEVEVYKLNDDSIHPGVIITPGGTGDIAHNYKKFSNLEDYTFVEKYASEGFVALVFSAEGRGNSEGEEDYNGYIDQDGLYQLYRFLKERKDVNPEKIGFISLSYGVAMDSGMLGRYQVPAAFYIEWEGPVDRYYVSVGCKGGVVKEEVTCSDEDYWNEREAIKFVQDFKVSKFQIVQTFDDHAQPTVQHSVDINNLAIQYLDYVRVNDGEINQEYDVNTMPTIDDKEINSKTLKYAKEFVE